MPKGRPTTQLKLSSQNANSRSSLVGCESDIYGAVGSSTKASIDLYRATVFTSLLDDQRCSVDKACAVNSLVRLPYSKADAEKYDH